MRVDQFDYELPPGHIALRPCRPRDAARLLVVDPNKDPCLSDRRMAELADVLRPGDAFVFNNTRVIPAVLLGRRKRKDSEARVAVTLLKALDGHRWQALARPAKRLKPGDRIDFGATDGVCLQGTLGATVLDRHEDGEVILSFEFHGPILEEAIAALGKMPLPPYIAARRPVDDRDSEDYQTVYADRD
ncbi:MAG: S-adenosylmethionine:tRNA ribosyltransferase-isomerase, partial [Methyloligellaceae bacterium]